MHRRFVFASCVFSVQCILLLGAKAEPTERDLSQIKVGVVASDLSTALGRNIPTTCSSKWDRIEYYANGHTYWFDIGTNGYIWRTMDKTEISETISTSELFKRVLAGNKCHLGQPSQTHEFVGTFVNRGNAEAKKHTHEFVADWDGPIETSLFIDDTFTDHVETGCSSTSQTLSGMFGMIYGKCPAGYAFCPRFYVR